MLLQLLQVTYSLVCELTSLMMVHDGELKSVVVMVRDGELKS
jgi:hypothetical protein